MGMAVEFYLWENKMDAYDGYLRVVTTTQGRSDPANPIILGELKIPCFSEYMHVYDESHLLAIGCEIDPKTVLLKWQQLRGTFIRDNFYLMKEKEGIEAYDLKSKKKIGEWNYE